MESKPKEYRYFDGSSAREQWVHISAETSAIRLIEAKTGDVIAVWPFADLRLLPKAVADDPPRLTVRQNPDARLMVDPAVLGHLPQMPPLLGRASADIKPLLRTVGLWAAGLAALAVSLPTLARVVLVPLIPHQAASALGETAEEQVVTLLANLPGQGTPKTCVDPVALAHLTGLTQEFGRAAGLRHPVVLTVYDLKVPNAFALPGNRVVVTRGLLERMRSTGQLAGVIAHEVAHLQTEDPLTGLISGMGWGMLGSLVFGTGSLSGLGQQIVTSGYSRDVESRADANGVKLLASLGYEQGGLAEALDRLDPGNRRSTAGDYLSSHPNTAERRRTLNDLAGNGKAIPPTDYTILQRACAKLEMPVKD